MWRQAFRAPLCRVRPTPAELEAGVVWIFCRECDGKGVFHCPDFEERCVACKGTGREPVAIW